jgi:broad specificity phosphatase PhoE
MTDGACTVFLVRHGEVRNPDHLVYADLPGFPLSSTGRRQAEYTAQRLPPNAAVVTSPLDRALETATIIASAGGGRIVADADLTEWRLASRWAGRPWDKLDAAFPGELSDYLAHPRDLPFAPESLDELARRVAGAVRRHRSAIDGPLVFVSHQDPIQSARLLLTGRPLETLNDDKPQHAGVAELLPRDASSWTECAMWAPAQAEVQPSVVYPPPGQ